ncbi:MAG: hypothetical protein R6X23_06390 [Acidimicrobiia bacterium]
MIVVEPRFCGPPHSGHGGYVAGRLAMEVGEPAEVTLRLPPPLERPLEVERHGDTAVLRDGDTVVAEAKVIDRVDVAIPDPIRFADAEAAADAGRAALESFAFRTCFACGTDRRAPDGLALVFGPVPARDDGLHAAPWVPDASLAGVDGNVRPEFVWAALDCPGVSPLLDHASEGSAFVLGRLAVERLGAVPVGYRYIVLSRLEHRDGRKGTVAVALTTDMGDLRARARATWIEVDRDRFEAEALAS